MSNRVPIIAETKILTPQKSKTISHKKALVK